MPTNTLLKLIATITLLSTYSCNNGTGSNKSMTKSIDSNAPSSIYGSQDLEGYTGTNELYNGSSLDAVNPTQESQYPGAVAYLPQPNNQDQSGIDDLYNGSNLTQGSQDLNSLYPVPEQGVEIAMAQGEEFIKLCAADIMMDNNAKYRSVLNYGSPEKFCVKCGNMKPDYYPKGSKPSMFQCIPK
jgi:hypothetical protein